MSALAGRSFGPPYECVKPWPEGVTVQCGDHGVVFTKGTLDRIVTDPPGVLESVASIEAGGTGGYTTAFFEAFPDDTFIRGEGSTVAEAEASAWEQYQRHQACEEHEWETRGYTNGAAFCARCGKFSSRQLMTPELLAEERRWNALTDDQRLEEALASIQGIRDELGEASS